MKAKHEDRARNAAISMAFRTHPMWSFLFGKYLAKHVTLSLEQILIRRDHIYQKYLGRADMLCALSNRRFVP
jgi:hypothetical protein